MIIFSDLHVHNWQKPRPRLQITLSVIEQVFAEAYNRGESILFCGDLFDRQNTLPAEVVTAVYNKFKYCFSKYLYTDFYAVSGNHDQFYREDGTIGTMLDIFTAFNNFHLIDNKVVDIDGYTVYGIPHTRDRDTFQGRLRSYRPDVLAIHQTYDEFIEGEFSVHDEYIKSIKFVFNGHIHKPAQFGNVYIVGSPLHRDLSDVGQKKFIYRLNENRVEKIETNYPEFRFGEPKDDFHFYIKKYDVSKVQEEIDDTIEFYDIDETLKKFSPSITHYKFAKKCLSLSKN